MPICTFTNNMRAPTCPTLSTLKLFDLCHFILVSEKSLSFLKSHSHFSNDKKWNIYAYVGVSSTFILFIFWGVRRKNTFKIYSPTDSWHQQVKLPEFLHRSYIHEALFAYQ